LFRTKGYFAEIFLHDTEKSGAGRKPICPIRKKGGKAEILWLRHTFGFFSMLDELISTIGAREFNSGVLYLTSINKQHDGLRLAIKLGSSLNDNSIRRWTIRCDYPLKHNVELGDYYDLSIASNHVLLWEHIEPKIAVSFSGRKRENAHFIVGELCDAHKKLCGNWIPFGRFFNMSNRISDLISGGHGQLGEGPETLMSVYEVVLRKHGFQTNSQILLNRLDDFSDLGVLILGNSYIVATNFTAKRWR
jgi:hypothetical protein